MKNAASKNDIAFRIREMVEGDLSRVTALENEIFPDPWPKSAFLEDTYEEIWSAIIAEIDDGIIAYACYYVTGPEAHLTNIAVDSEFRRKSVAKKLLDHIFRSVKNIGCEYIILEVRPGNKEACDFYKKLGFELMYRQPDYYQHPVEDALVMVFYFD